MSRWLSNKDSVLQSKKITFQLIFKPHDPLFPWAAGLPWGAFPKVVKDLLELAHSQGVLTENGLDLVRGGGAAFALPKGAADVVPAREVAASSAQVEARESQATVVAHEPFVIRRYKPA
ncbi:hypothetical protein EV700_3203 [Fluviicoccus keumensis]|uniref:Uncharacterized protein n=1 Tax=Fluviicoccus keumensis TaxID=1435465 RepID=A0A4Q7YH55_9GAMM|nr:hypothetical protein [Fluviicoccus keumensis]RZU36737.1 hypothetical protein EV700_3203 [Fluviicoccus keumensis]